MCWKNVFYPLLVSFLVPNNPKQSNGSTKGIGWGIAWVHHNVDYPSNVQFWRCIYIYTELRTSRTNYSLVPLKIDFNRHPRASDKYHQILCSDYKQLKEELEAAGQSLQGTVLRRNKKLVLERNRVWGHPVHCRSVDSLYCSSQLQYVNGWDWRKIKHKQSFSNKGLTSS